MITVKSVIYTPKRDDEHSYNLYIGVSPERGEGGGGGVITLLVDWGIGDVLYVTLLRSIAIVADLHRIASSELLVSVLMS